MSPAGGGRELGSRVWGARAGLSPPEGDPHHQGFGELPRGAWEVPTWSAWLRVSSLYTVWGTVNGRLRTSGAPICLSPTCPHPETWLAIHPVAQLKAQEPTPNSPPSPLPPDPQPSTGKSQGFPKTRPQSLSFCIQATVCHVSSGLSRMLLELPAVRVRAHCLPYSPLTPHLISHPIFRVYPASRPALHLLCLCLTPTWPRALSPPLQFPPSAPSSLARSSHQPGSFLPSTLTPPALEPSRLCPLMSPGTEISELKCGPGLPQLLCSLHSGVSR